MAGTINGIQVYDATSRMIEALAVDRVNQRINIWNSASNGALTLAGFTDEGDFSQRKFVKSIRDAQYRRDPSSGAVVAQTAYTEGNQNSVKVAGGFGPIYIPDAILMWAGEGKPSAEVSIAMNEVADQYAEAYIKDQLNVAISAVANGLGEITDVVNDVSTGGETIDQLKLNDTKWLFGDRAGDIVMWLGHSGAYSQLIGDAIANANALDTVGGVAINEGNVRTGGLPFVYTDDPSLKYDDGTTDVYRVMGLTKDGVVVTVVKQISAMNKITGTQNIGTEWQANYDFKVTVKGLSWDTSAGGAYPTDAEIATGTNWPQVVTEIKDVAGVVLITPQVKTP